MKANRRNHALQRLLPHGARVDVPLNPDEG
jgi:hypothetical protein